MTEPAGSPSKTCFVTIGATAGFDALLSAALEASFLDSLRDHEYTDLLLQYGNEGVAIFNDFISKSEPGSKTRKGIRVNGFAFNDLGLGQEMRTAKGEHGVLEGVVISHAGMLSS
jgi:beta-1,4-N-acetylglucosaminyltransferase